MATASVTTRVYNLSFDSLFPSGQVRGIQHYRLLRASAFAGLEVAVGLAFSNDQETWENQQILPERYATLYKQSRDYNPRLSLCTGFLAVEYDNHLSRTALLVAAEEINHDLEMFALLFSFAQRRRVIIDPVNLRSDSGVIALNMAFAGDLIDTIGFNPPLVSPHALWDFYDRFRLNAGMAIGELNLLNQIKRYLATFISPYLDERIDALWKVCESVGREVERIERDSPFRAAHETVYKAALAANQWTPKPSLLTVTAALARFDLTFDWLELDEIRQLRNRMAHEYIADATLDAKSWGANYRLLNEIVERLILAQFSASDLGSYGFGPQAIVNGKAL